MGRNRRRNYNKKKSGAKGVSANQKPASTVPVDEVVTGDVNNDRDHNVCESKEDEKLVENITVADESLSEVDETNLSTMEISECNNTLSSSMSNTQSVEKSNKEDSNFSVENNNANVGDDDIVVKSEDKGENDGTEQQCIDMSQAGNNCDYDTGIEHPVSEHTGMDIDKDETVELKDAAVDIEKTKEFPPHIDSLSSESGTSNYKIAEYDDDGDDDDDDDDASLSDLILKSSTDGDVDGFVDLSKSTTGENNNVDMDSPSSSDSYVVITEGEEENEHEGRYNDASPLHSNCSFDNDATLLYSNSQNREEILMDESTGKSNAENGMHIVQNFYSQESMEPNYIEEDEEESGEEFEEEDGFVMKDSFLKLEQEKEEAQEHPIHYDGTLEEGKTDGYFSLEPRVAIAVALKVVSILRINGVLDGESSGKVKDKIFGGDQEILRAIEEFTMTHSVEHLVSIIHGKSL